MKNIYFIIALFSFVLMGSVTPGYAQRRLPDPPIIHPDGPRRLPNRPIDFPKPPKRNTKGVNRTINHILHPHRNHLVNTHRRRYKHRRPLPPGHAKKIYAGSAKNYAPGHHKGNGN
jgi:hypothetical protein